MTDAMVSTGLAALGYEYINLDDCWAELNRDSKGNLVPNVTIFPSGMKTLADYVHSKGLKIGIYADAGTLTCDKRMPGSLGYEEHDANTFASWAYFNAPDGDEPLALDMGSMGKGQVWINGQSIGRYWTAFATGNCNGHGEYGKRSLCLIKYKADAW
ncbi:unnamed protein product [Camellia sinensis]